MLSFRSGGRILGMRYAAIALALFVVATAAAAQQWRGTASTELQPIELRPSEPPAETKATLLDLKRPPVLAPPKTKAAAPKLATPTTPERAAKPRPRPPATYVAPAPRRLALGAEAAPAPAPVRIPADDDNDNDDNDDGAGDDD
jgi:hypothetical protein